MPIVPAIRIQRTVQYSDGTLAITEPDTRSSISTVRYTILSGNDDGYFNMDPLDGDVFLVRQIDREQLPGSAVGDRFVLTIQAASSLEISSATSSRARIFIDIEDINDNLPAFDTNDYTISIVENLPINFHVLQLSATDNDLVNELIFGWFLSVLIYFEIGRKLEIYISIERHEWCVHDRSRHWLVECDQFDASGSGKSFPLGVASRGRRAETKPVDGQCVHRPD